MKRLANLGLGLVAVSDSLAWLSPPTPARHPSPAISKTPTATARWARRAPGHKQCAIKCASAGIPVTLIEKGTEKSYILLPNKDASPLPQSVISRMEDEVTVTGKEYSKNGTEYIVVESVK